VAGGRGGREWIVKYYYSLFCTGTVLEVVCYQEKEKNCPELDFFAEHVNFGVKDEKVIEFFGPEKSKKMMTLKKI